jgi:hypothetical protein
MSLWYETGKKNLAPIDMQYLCRGGMASFGCLSPAE